MTPPRPTPWFVLAFVLPLATIAGAGETLADPTRPPGLPASAEVTAVTPATPVAPVAPPKLQSVQVGQDGKASALVDGRLLRLGDRLGELEVIKLDLTGLTLRAPGKPARFLPLLAAAVRQPLAPASPTTPQLAAAGDRP